ncbi:MAG: FHA domain-containing protein [Kiritimatiellia bacterium]
MYRLVIQSGRHQGKRLVVRQTLTLIGSGADCHLPLPDDPDLAPRHARLEERGTGVYLTSLCPERPVRLNDAPVQAEVRLGHGDRLAFGQTTVEFQDIIAPHQRLRPSHGLLQPATVLVAAAIVVLELALLAFLVDWPRRIIRPETEAADLARVAEVRAVRAAEKAAETGTVAAAGAATVAVLPGTAPGAAPAAGADPNAAPAPPPSPTVDVLAQADFTPADTNFALIEPPPISAADPAIAAAQRTLAEATAAAQFADYARAFRLLNQIHQDLPGFLPAHVEHARLLETRGNLDEAYRRWSVVQGAAPEGSPFRARAARERERLAELQELQSRIPQTPAGADLDDRPRQVRIGPPRIQKMTADEDVAEMRVLNAELALAPDAQLFKNAAIQVFVTFYDVDQNGAVRPTRALVPTSPIALGQAFADRRSTALQATYVVPRGLRDQELRETGRQSEFYGYALHVFAGQILQDAAAKPKKLLDLPIHVPTPASEP